MPLTPTIRRALMKACGVLLLWLVPATEGFAAHAPRVIGRTCDPQTTSIRKLIRQARAVGGPVAKKVRTKLRTAKPRTAHIERGTRARAAEDSQAIQNDAPVAHAAGPFALELRVVGIFVDRLERLPLALTVSPQSPRGPPAAA
jgi:hypothetical protein